MTNNKERINELALELKGGNQSAFTELYKLTYEKAYYIAFKICGNHYDSEDIVQDSFVTVLTKISSLEKSESFTSWFGRIVTNKSKDVLKKKSPSLFAQGEEREFDIVAETDDYSPEETVEKSERSFTILSAVKNLAAEKRECVIKKYYGEMSLNEIASDMKTTISAVKNRLLTARKDLKVVFEEKGITAA